jgi:hypothetical protein
VKELLEKINKDGKVMSESTLRRILKKEDYADFFTIR